MGVEPKRQETVDARWRKYSVTDQFWIGVSFVPNCVSTRLFTARGCVALFRNIVQHIGARWLKTVPIDASGVARRVALVMAGSRGLGFGTACSLGLAGHRLIICARDVAGLDKAVVELRALGVEASGVRADVARSADLRALFDIADSTYGRLDVLVVNAGGPPHGGFLEVGDSQWRQTFNLTLMSAVRSIRLAVPRMRSGGFGRVIVIGSSSVKRTIDGLVLSNTFRPALWGLVKSFAREVAADGITVNMVSPGRIDTGHSRLDERRAKLSGQSYKAIRAAGQREIPAGRYGKPEDLGNLIAFLASEAGAYVTGQSILVDGGLVSAL